MKGLIRAKKFFFEYGLPMIERDFPKLKARVAAGLVGHGSECFGFDDEVSVDHDFENGFCIWLTADDEKEHGFALSRAYRKLLKEVYPEEKQDIRAFGSKYKGVHTIEEFYSFYLGAGGVEKSAEEWLAVPDFYLAEATNGEVFYDGLGEFTRIRRSIEKRPEDVRLKKLASALFNAAQSGQYNYPRCIKHGERASAGVALIKFAESAADAAFLLSRKFKPYYKWEFKALRLLDGFGRLADILEEAQERPFEAERNVPLIERAAATLIERLKADGYTGDKGDYLEAYAYAVNDLVSDGKIRNMPVML